ncbi:ferredoxin family protein [Candidatus Latescibacterota bacterium]
MKYNIHVEKSRCKGVDGCGLCINICPKKVYRKSDTLSGKGVYPPVPVYADNCNGCELCMMYCPDLVLVIEPAEED